MTPASTELADRILATLEEAHIDNVFTLLNTVTDHRGSDDEVAAFVVATRDLFERRLIETGLIHKVPRRREDIFEADRAAMLLGELQTWFIFDRTLGFWTSSRGDMRTTSFPLIYLTPSGLEESRRLLGERGYDWWRPRR